MGHLEANLVDISCKICTRGMDGAGISVVAWTDGKGFC
jgi:hypothetical protein